MSNNNGSKRSQPFYEDPWPRTSEALSASLRFPDLLVFKISRLKKNGEPYHPQGMRKKYILQELGGTVENDT